METNEIVKALNRLKVETGSLVCLGCGHEHNCGVHGCAVLRETVGLLEKQERKIQTLKAELVSGRVQPHPGRPGLRKV